ncbi:hypothetical protein RRG08_062033 [Elysia crispata]|uniref:Uncharacterized protein n=1 Tax=Elysia crispata TaxID=231223 RepID=A0AAE1A3Q2_9GAST|nr:hypothetical protein RRG08_062033 [Elysia crispata]
MFPPQGEPGFLTWPERDYTSDGLAPDYSGPNLTKLVRHSIALSADPFWAPLYPHLESSIEKYSRDPDRGKFSSPTLNVSLGYKKQTEACVDGKKMVTLSPAPLRPALPSDVIHLSHHSPTAASRAVATPPPSHPPRVSSASQCACAAERVCDSIGRCFVHVTRLYGMVCTVRTIISYRLLYLASSRGQTLRMRGGQSPVIGRGEQT